MVTVSAKLADSSFEEDDALFEEIASEVLLRLRKALVDILAALPAEIAKGADLHRVLQIDRKLSWCVFRVASASDPISAGVHVPSRASMRTFFKAVRKQGVSDALIESASRVAADFEDLVDSYAGDRATFDSMVSALAPDEAAEQIDLVHRRLAFRGQRHILGAYAKTHLKFIAMQPNQEKPAWLDGILVQGFVGLRQLRGDAPLVISYSGARNDDGTPLEMRRAPLEPIPNSHGMALLQDFCTQPLPELRVVENGENFMRAELATRDVGKRAAIDCVEGHVRLAALPRFSAEGNRIGHTVMAVRTPCESIILDLALHKDTYGPLQPRASAHAEFPGISVWEAVTKDLYRLPGRPAVKYLGRGPSVLHTPDYPRYTELGRYVFERAGWNADEFDVYRCQIEYPVLPSSIVMDFDLPDPPQE